ncbi:hypothetical protein E2C01_095966 [Portunus trituberculatus]|uniref:Uncharacterized protein n=1 Tax=Portunus trituberculatus TaxID=210409 RepID=A0A5B7JRE3_PORTR|nr:hypothetical protein [Portunus trituberculatus]
MEEEEQIYIYSFNYPTQTKSPKLV